MGVHGLGGHVEVLLGGQGSVVKGRRHRPHLGLHVVLGAEPHGALVVRGPSLVGPEVKSGALLPGGIEPHRAVKPHLVWGAVEVQGPLLEAHWTRAGGIESSHWSFEVTGAVESRGAVKPPGALRVGGPLEASHWPVRRVGGAIKVVWAPSFKPAWLMRPIEAWGVVVPHPALEPSRRGPVCGSWGPSVVALWWGGGTSVLRGGVSWGVAVSNGGQRADRGL